MASLKPDEVAVAIKKGLITAEEILWLQLETLCYTYKKNPDEVRKWDSKDARYMSAIRGALRKKESESLTPED